MTTVAPLHLDGEVTIRRPVEEVFDFVADERNEPLYNHRMNRAQLLSDEPVGPGSRFSAEMKSGGRFVQMVVELTAYERPRRLASSAHLAAMDVSGHLSFDAVPDGTLMHWVWDVRPKGVLRLLSPGLAVLGRRQEEAVWEELKTALEHDTSDAPPTVGIEGGAEQAGEGAR